MPRLSDPQLPPDRQRDLRPDPAKVTALLCDADGTLFPSEEPAFDASAGVVNAALGSIGLAASYQGEELRRVASGRNFRSLVADLATAAGRRFPDGELESWVEREVEVVTEHLGRTLRPDEAVTAALGHLEARLRLALVSSSALRRLATCLDATGLAGYFDDAVRFSAQDSLPVPTSKPDPAVYARALAALDLSGESAVAVEDAEAGVRSAVAAGVPVVGILCFVPPDERVARSAELTAAGAFAVVDGWREVADLLVGTVQRDEEVA